MGDNINGPSLIRVPDWVERPLGRYYQYFAHHDGRYIRLAYSHKLHGPWTSHRPYPPVTGRGTAAPHQAKSEKSPNSVETIRGYTCVLEGERRAPV